MSHDYIILANIIDNCNYACRYCYNVKPYTKRCLDLNVLLKFLLNNKYVQSKKNIMLNIEGGEPTLHEELESFCKAISQCKNIKTYIYTNLSNTCKYYDLLLSYDNINLVATWHLNNYSIDFVDKVLLLKKYYDKIEVVVMYEDINIQKSIETYNKIKTTCNNLIELNYICKTKTYSPKYTDADDKLYINLANLQHDNKQFSYSKDGITYSYTEPELMFYTENFNFKNYLCFASLLSLYIHNDGKMYYCPSYYLEEKESIGNIYNSYKLTATPILCKCNHCSDYLDIDKKQIFVKH